MDYRGVPMTGLGGGDDPVGFLIASHRELVRQRAVLRAKYPEILNEIEFESDERLGDENPAR